MKKRSKKFYIIGSLIIIVVAAVVVASLNSGDDLISVQADLAVSDDISEIVTASGRIQPQTKVNITSEVSAEIVQLFVKEGDFVNKGTPLLLLDTVQYNSDAEQARYSLDEVKARAAAALSQYEKDKSEFERQSRLYHQNLSSETEFINAKFAIENSKAMYEANQAQVKTAQARLEKSEDNLKKTSINAPMDGVIIYLSAEVGEIAQAQTSFTQGKTLMTIADLSVFEVEVDIDETQIANVQLDQAVEIRVDAYDDSVFLGTVAEIGNSATVSGQGTEEFTTAFRVKVRFTKSNVTIRPGMSATVDITTASASDALLIPYAAVVTKTVDPDSLENMAKAAKENENEDSSPNAVMAASNSTDESVDADKPRKKKKEEVKVRGVYLVHDGIAKFREITTGIADERNIVALTGINPGDTVISGSFKTLRALKENDKVKIDQLSIDKMNENN